MTTLQPTKKSFAMNINFEPVTISYYDWPGPPNARTIICCHGLTGNGRNFDRLAAALSNQFRVVCPEMPGRGDSTWLKNPFSYNFMTYENVGLALLEHLKEGGLNEPVDWIGTSMGGLIGMMLAARKGLIRRLILNDVGPVIYKGAIPRMQNYVGTNPTFTSVEGLEQYLRRIHEGFGPLPDEQWHEIAAGSSRRLADGRFALNYDPAIGLPFRALDLWTNFWLPFWMPALFFWSKIWTQYWLPGPDLTQSITQFLIPDVDCWSTYDQVTAPTLVLRGALSDVLRREDAVQMTTRGPKAQLIEFEGIGHVPVLMNDDQIGIVRDFLCDQKRNLDSGRQAMSH